MVLRSMVVALVAGWPLWVGCSQHLRDTRAAAWHRPEETRGVQNAQQGPAPRIMPATHVTAGQMLERQGNIAGAIEQYERAIAANPRFTTAYNRLGILYEKLGKFAEADHFFKQGILADPGSAMLRNNLGYSYLVQGRYDEAEDEFREALTISPEFKRARMNLAITLARKGRLDESVSEFSRVVPADIAHYNVAVICTEVKDYTSAERSLRQALAINPDCAGAREQLDRIIRLAISGAPRRERRTPSNNVLAGDVEAGQTTDSP